MRNFSPELQTFPDLQTFPVYCERGLSGFVEHAACFECGRCACEVDVYDDSYRDYGRSCLVCEREGVGRDAYYAALDEAEQRAE